MGWAGDGQEAFPSPNLLLLFPHFPLAFLGQSPEKSTGEKETWPQSMSVAVTSWDADKIPRAHSQLPHHRRNKGRKKQGMFGWQDETLEATLIGLHTGKADR